MVPNCAATDGAVSDAYRRFNQARAGVGCMVLGAADVHPAGRGFKRQLGIHTAIELHACHACWLNFILSPHFNHRQDQYGGSLENRLRLLREVIQSTEAEVGSSASGGWTGRTSTNRQ
ncbi:MAG: hypothetical protein JSW39_29115 [Desulfobacterales bacterium]|nr:MAG: hypothetical protein JSW39_29115 [Desulfobacterales bacterium]